MNAGPILVDMVGYWHTQITQISPEAPPGSNGLLKLMRWLMWVVLLAGIAGIIYGGGRFAWERWNGGALESPKIVIGALVGGVIATSAAAIMNAVVTVS